MDLCRMQLYLTHTTTPAHPQKTDVAFLDDMAAWMRNDPAAADGLHNAVPNMLWCAARARAVCDMTCGVGQCEGPSMASRAAGTLRRPQFKFKFHAKASLARPPCRWSWNPNSGDTGARCRRRRGRAVFGACLHACACTAAGTASILKQDIEPALYI